MTHLVAVVVVVVVLTAAYLNHSNAGAPALTEKQKNDLVKTDVSLWSRKPGASGTNERVAFLLVPERSTQAASFTKDRLAVNQS